MLMDPDEGVVRHLERQELRAHLKTAIEGLPERERQILALYYEEELTLVEIGEVIGVCESRVSQLRSLALSRLRTSLRESIGIETKVGVKKS
jgi:RNA polymerase sigma factor for flagellar operon FliA